jgi:membrane-bound lytic murein transglycosylase D
MKPSEAAKMVGMAEAKLREINRIPGRVILKAGSTLLIPRAAHSTKDVTPEVAQNGTLALAPEANRKPAKKSSSKTKNKKARPNPAQTRSAAR